MTADSQADDSDSVATDGSDPLAGTDETMRLAKQFPDAPFVTVVLETLRAQQIVDLDADGWQDPGRERVLAEIVAARLAEHGV